MTTAVRLLGFNAIRPWFRPGSDARFLARLETTARTAVAAELELHNLDQVIARTGARWRLEPGRHERALTISLPREPRVGYTARLTLRTRDGRAIGAAEQPLEALDGWWDAPRHACLTEFRAAADVESIGTRLAEWNVTVVQLYDWMYRHYRYLPPGGERTFDDALGRSVSLDVVRSAIRSCQASGIAALAYGAVYGAEREYADRHPDEIVRRDGQPVSLGGTFFITDLRPESPWRRRLLREYERACRALGFDGVHMDQYGREFRGRAPDGAALDFPGLFRGVVDEADARLRAVDPGRRVLFNAVGAWPLPEAAASASAATYIELWPPDTSYRDVVARIDQARALAPDKAVVIAAYLSTLHRGRPRPRSRIEAALLLGAVIHAAGAHWHGVAGGNRLLVDGYYPLAAPMSRREIEAVRAIWRFSARYHHMLYGSGLRRVRQDVEITDASGRPVPLSDAPQAGAVWVRVAAPAAASANGTVAISLVDLRRQADPAWDAVKAEAGTAAGWTLRLPGHARRIRLASPWSHGGLLRPAAPAPANPAAGHRLPSFDRWALVLASRE